MSARPDATSSAFSRSTQSPLRSRRPAPSPNGSASPVAHRQEPRRRSSMVSLASEFSVGSFRSSTDNLLIPRASKHGDTHASDAEHSSHLHSLPLFLAIVPAIAGIFFRNGTAIMTDLTLLGMAAILLNWSIRVPWNWYHSAQAVRHQDSINTEDFLPADMIVEEASDAEDLLQDKESRVAGDETAEADDGSSSPRPKAGPTPLSSNRVSPEQLAAAASLRRHEILALFACFACPLIGASFLHAVREQLSRPSEGLVSNYNLTIFLLAAEIRPLSHLIKLVQNRTVHLQRVVATDPHRTDVGEATVAGIPASNEALAALSARIAVLESQGPPTDVKSGDKGSSPTSPTSLGAPLSVTPKEELVTDVRRSMQPDIDALNRAVRRYEKRATLLSLQIDSRLSALESRVADSIALAAAAERTASGARKGSLATLMDWAAGLVVVPVRAAVWAAGKVLEIPAKITKTITGLGAELVGLVTGNKGGYATRDETRGKGRTRDRDGSKTKVKRIG